ncbi:MAG: phosphate ABC transporter permease subunit PstC [Chloroflexi bacterium]|nr:phosphate ABC transporter permease subunit PstC [Chloroflexota bacterium]
MNKKLRVSQTEVAERAITRGLALIAFSSLSVLALITVFILREGLPVMLNLGIGEFLTGGRWAPSANAFGIMPMILGSVYVTLGALVLGVPLGLSCAVFLVELAPRSVAAALRPAIQLLAGIPSVIYGFWGLTTLVPFIRNTLGGPGLSILAGAIILGIMILPTVIAISEDALRALPRSYKEASFSLGASHWQTIWRVLLPAARSGIVAAVVLGMGRAVGETMAVIMVLGNAVQIPDSILDPARTLTTNIGIEMAYASGDHRAALFATGIVLFLIIMILTGTANLITSRR